MSIEVTLPLLRKLHTNIGEKNKLLSKRKIRILVKKYETLFVHLSLNVGKKTQPNK